MLTVILLNWRGEPLHLEGGAAAALAASIDPTTGQVSMEEFEAAARSLLSPSRRLTDASVIAEADDGSISRWGAVKSRRRADEAMTYVRSLRPLYEPHVTYIRFTGPDGRSEEATEAAARWVEGRVNRHGTFTESDLRAAADQVSHTHPDVWGFDVATATGSGVRRMVRQEGGDVPPA